MSFLYIVKADLPDEKVAGEWEKWLVEGHMKAVIEKGKAVNATLLRISLLSYEVIYVFPSKEAFELYDKNEAPVLRGEGLKLFPPEVGIKYSRVIGDVVATVV